VSNLESERAILVENAERAQQVKARQFNLTARTFRRGELLREDNTGYLVKIANAYRLCFGLKDPDGSGWGEGDGCPSCGYKRPFSDEKDLSGEEIRLCPRCRRAFLAPLHNQDDILNHLMDVNLGYYGSLVTILEHEGAIAAFAWGSPVTHLDLTRRIVDVRCKAGYANRKGGRDLVEKLLNHPQGPGREAELFYIDELGVLPAYRGSFETLVKLMLPMIVEASATHRNLLFWTDKAMSKIADAAERGGFTHVHCEDSAHAFVNGAIQEVCQAIDFLHCDARKVLSYLQGLSPAQQSASGEKSHRRKRHAA